MAKEDDDAIYTILFNKKKKRFRIRLPRYHYLQGWIWEIFLDRRFNNVCWIAHYVGDARLVAALSLETNEGKRHLCLSMSPTQKPSGVLQHFGLDKSNSRIIISGAGACYMLEEELDEFPKDEYGVLQMTIKPREIDEVRFPEDEDKISQKACVII